MKTIFELFLDALQIDYTHQFATNLYNGHPHRDNMYGLKKIFLLSLFAFCSSTIIHAQDVTLVGQVQDDFIKKPLVARISVYETDSTTCILDSAHVERIEDGNGDIIIAPYYAPVKAVIHDYLIKAELEGYDVVWQKASVTDITQKEVVVPLIKMRKSRTISLKDVVVTATKVKMFYRGDTLVYDATAFNMPDGSMLDGLIRQMPGVTMNDEGEIFVNGKKIDELLLGSRTFFGGNKQVLMENLPYYTVKHIKVYDKTHKLDEVRGVENPSKEHVMDVILKEDYNRGYIANVEGAYGTDNRWLGRAFGLGFTDRTRFTLLGNINNVNETQHIGKNNSWSPTRTPRSMITTRSVRSEIDYQSKDEMIGETFRTEFASSTENQHMRQNREQFLISGNPLSISERIGKSSNWKLALHNDLTMYAPKYMMFFADFSYGKRNGNSNSTFEQWNDSLIATMRTTGMSEGTSWSGKMELLSDFSLWKKLITYVVYAEHRSDKSEGASRYDTRNHVSPTSELRNNATDYAKKVTSGGLELSDAGRVTDKLQYRLKNKTDISYSTIHDFLYHPDTLLLASQLDALNAITDVGNSYDSKFRSVTNVFEVSISTHNNIQPDKKSSSNWEFGVQVPFTYHSLDYQRGSIDTLATTKTLFVTPWLSYSRKTSRKHELRLSTRHRQTTANIYDMINYRDDSNPLVVKLGAPGLKGHASTNAEIALYGHKTEHSQKQWNASASFNYHHRDVSQSVIYNSVSGVYTYKPVNVSGAYIADAKFQVSNTIGEKRYFSWQNISDASFHHSLDHSMLVGETESYQNTVNTLALHDAAYIQYSKNKLNIRATADFRWRYSEGRMRDFENLNAFDYQYGLSGTYTIPSINITVSADANMYSRRGYGTRELDTDDFILNASISKPFLKGKFIASIEGIDLLHNLSSTQYAVNAQGRTITWYRSLPHYVMAHLVYHWNKNPKKK